LPTDTALTISPELCDRAKAINKALKSAGLSIVTAESCTAGMIAAVLSRADAADAVSRERTRRHANRQFRNHAVTSTIRRDEDDASFVS
jgi:hypothetical protein